MGVNSGSIFLVVTDENRECREPADRNHSVQKVWGSGMRSRAKEGSGRFFGETKSFSLGVNLVVTLRNIGSPFPSLEKFCRGSGETFFYEKLYYRYCSSLVAGFLVGPAGQIRVVPVDKAPNEPFGFADANDRLNRDLP